MVLDLDKLKSDMRSAGSVILKEDVTRKNGYDEKHISKIASLAENLASNIKSGWITAETRDFMMDSIRKHSMKFAGSIDGLGQVTKEKLCLALVYVVSKAVTDATGTAAKS